MLKMEKKMDAYTQILELNARFAWLIDHQDGDGVAELFTQDGIYGFGEKQAIGRDQINGFYQMRKNRGLRQSRHLFSNPVVLNQSENSISACCVLTLFAFDGEGPHPADIHLIADYQDEFVRDDQGIWRYESRVIQPIFGHVPNLTEK